MRLLRFAPALLLAVPALAHAASTGAAATTTDVKVGGQAGNVYAPPTIHVTLGDAVRWTNAGGDHNVVFDDGQFVSGPPSTSAWTATHAFTSAGTFTYQCAIHGPRMSGTVVVDPAGTGTATPTASPTGTPTATAVPTTSPAPVPTTGPLSTPTVVAGPGPVMPRPKVTSLRVRRRATRRAGVKGTLRIQPAGVDLRVVVTVGRRVAGAHAYRGAGAKLAFSIRLDKRARTVLRRRGRLALVVHVRAGGTELAHRTVSLK